jgi:hypothetical protein
MTDGRDAQSTQRTARRRTDTPRWWRSATGIVLTALVAFACAATLVITILGAVWLILAGVQLGRYRWDRRICLAPAMVALTATLVFFGVPSDLGWRLSVGELTAYAQACTPSSDDQRIGLYDTWRVEPLDTGCHFYLEGGLVNLVGVAHLPGGTDKIGLPERDGEIGYQHIESDWYRFVQIF